ncbi:MAG: protoporphyrinogen oxidase [Acidimicrobiia bacterium]
MVVVGGGLSGLFTASELVAAGLDDLVVLEGSPAPGGVARTITGDGFMLEPAAGSVSLPHPHLSPILERIGAEMTGTAPAAGVRYLYVNGRLMEVPPSPRALLAPMVPWGSKLRALAEPLVRNAPPHVEESLEGFCERRFGHAAGRMLAWLMASGVYGGDPERLSARSAFPMLAGLADQHGSVVRGGLRRRRQTSERPKPHTPADGMAALARTAARSLAKRFRAGFPVESVRREDPGWVVRGAESMRADAVVVATHPAQAAVIVDEELADHLSKVQSAPVAVVGLGGTGGSVPSGFGVLIGPGEPLMSLGILLESSYAPESAPEGGWLLKMILGGARHPEVVDWDDGRLVERGREEAALVLGMDLEPSFAEVVRHRPGIPQPVIGHASWLSTLDHLLEDRPGLQLTGWGYRGVGVAHLATDAVRVAAALTR